MYHLMLHMGKLSLSEGLRALTMVIQPMSSRARIKTKAFLLQRPNIQPLCAASQSVLYLFNKYLLSTYLRTCWFRYWEMAKNKTHENLCLTELERLDSRQDE